jgi:hypothetical protein
MKNIEKNAQYTGVCPAAAAAAASSSNQILSWYLVLHLPERDQLLVAGIRTSIKIQIQ